MRAADIERQSTRGPANNQQTAHGNTKETGRFRRFRISLSILANSVMCSTAILIVVCRRMQDVSEAYRIAIKFSYSCWLISFLLVFFGLVHKQNTRAQRRLYVSSTVLLGIHMYGATLRNGDFYDGLVQFGPMILSASAYIAAAMFEARFGIVGVLQE
ncbi:hypothetical protein QBC47DRAFT_415422 [Echria macrotheca]|uniref:Uncharacterized protein n=1 Tax=Echria macrotheca TaxID=438768 RepID=A0AAJ0BBF6_9PEZI|nr:hypothetical protein QBC47DRAFT_415422 [Echria macrotheca]